MQAEQVAATALWVAGCVTLTSLRSSRGQRPIEDKVECCRRAGNRMPCEAARPWAEIGSGGMVCQGDVRAWLHTCRSTAGAVGPLNKPSSSRQEHRRRGQQGGMLSCGLGVVSQVPDGAYF